MWSLGYKGVIADITVLWAGVVRSNSEGTGVSGRQAAVEEDVPDLPSRTHGKTYSQPGAELRVRVRKVFRWKGGKCRFFCSAFTAAYDTRE